MADFTPSTSTKTAVRKFAYPIADVTVFENIVQSVITNNPFQCTAYHQAGTDHAPVERSRQGYTSRVIFEDTNAKQVGSVSIRAGDVAAFTTVANHIVDDPAIATSLGGASNRDYEHENYTVTLKCHDANGELYYLNFSRSQVSLSSYNNEAIRTRVETWADTVPALA